MDNIKHLVFFLMCHVTREYFQKVNFLLSWNLVQRGELCRLCVSNDLI